MDDFEYSVYISDRDWNCFFQECEECDILPPALAGLEESSISDFDETGCQTADKAPTLSTEGQILDPDLHADSSPEQVLSGSEDDKHLETVNLFLESLGDATERRKAEKYSDAADARERNEGCAEECDDKHVMKEKRLAVVSPVPNNTHKGFGNETVKEGKVSAKEGACRLMRRPNESDSEAETENSPGPSLALFIREEDWPPDPTNEETKPKREANSHDANKERNTHTETLNSPDIETASCPVLAGNKDMSEPKCIGKTGNQSVQRFNSDTKRAQAAQGQPSSASLRRKRRKKKRMSIEPVEPDQLLANQDVSDDERILQRTEVDKLSCMSDHYCVARVTEPAHETKGLLSRRKISSSLEDFPLRPQSAPRRTSVPESFSKSVTDLKSTPPEGIQSLSIMRAAQTTGRPDFLPGRSHQAREAGSAEQFVTQRNQRPPETHVRISETQRPPLQSNSCPSSPIDRDNVGQDLQPPSPSESVPASTAGSQTGKRVKEPEGRHVNFPTEPEKKISPQLIGHTKLGDGSEAVLERVNKAGQHFQTGDAVFYNAAAASLQSETQNCLKDIKTADPYKSSLEDGPPNQCQEGVVTDVSADQSDPCDQARPEPTSCSCEDLNTELAALNPSPTSEALNGSPELNDAVCTSPEEGENGSEPSGMSPSCSSQKNKELQEPNPVSTECVGNLRTSASPLLGNPPSDTQSDRAQTCTTSLNNVQLEPLSTGEMTPETGSFASSSNSIHSHSCEISGFSSKTVSEDQLKEKLLLSPESRSARSLSTCDEDKTSNLAVPSIAPVMNKTDSHLLTEQTVKHQCLEQNSSQQHTQVADASADEVAAKRHYGDSSLQSHVQESVSNVNSQNSTSPPLELLHASKTPKSEDIAGRSQPKHPVYTISSFWSEMEKLTINDILKLRLVSHAQHPGVLSPQTSNSLDASDATDSGYFTPVDDSKPGHSSGDMSFISDLDEELSHLQSQDNAKQGEGSFSPSPNPRDVLWESDPDPDVLGPGIGDGGMLSPETTTPQHPYITDTQQYLRKMCKNISVQNLQALECQPLRQLLRNASLHSIHSEAESEPPDPFYHLDTSHEVCPSDDEDMESYGICLSEIVQYLFGEDEPERCISEADNIAASYIDGAGTSVPEMYDHFFSEFETGSFFLPIVEEPGSTKNELVPIFSCSRSASRNLQFPEAYDYFFPDDSPVHSDEDEEGERTAIRVVTRNDTRVNIVGHPPAGPRSLENLHPVGDFPGNFWRNPLSLRRVRRTGVLQPLPNSSSWFLAPVSESGRMFCRSTNATGQNPYPEPLLLSLESRIFRQLAEQQRRAEMQMAVRDPRADAVLVPFKQADMCLVCIAFASWVLKSANPQGTDTWKAVLLANISALSAIRYLRRYKREEAAGKMTSPQIHPA